MLASAAVGPGGLERLLEDGLEPPDCLGERQGQVVRVSVHPAEREGRKEVACPCKVIGHGGDREAEARCPACLLPRRGACEDRQGVRRVAASEARHHLVFWQRKQEGGGGGG